MRLLFTFFISVLIIAGGCSLEKTESVSTSEIYLDDPFNGWITSVAYGTDEQLYIAGNQIDNSEAKAILVTCDLIKQEENLRRQIKSDLIFVGGSVIPTNDTGAIVSLHNFGGIGFSPVSFNNVSEVIHGVHVGGIAVSPSWSNFNSAATLNDGKVYVCGARGADAEYDIVFGSANLDGSNATSKTFPLAGRENVSSIARTADGNFVIAGWKEDVGGLSYALLMKVSPQGDLLWRDISTDAGSSLESVIATADGNIMACGQTGLASIGSLLQQELYLLKYSNNGDKLWSKTYGGSFDQSGNGIIQLADGNFAVCGTADNPDNVGETQGYVVKLDAAGNRIWTKSYGKQAQFSALTVDKTGLPVFVGKSGGRIYILKTDLDGNL